MAWTTTILTQYTHADRRIHVVDCVYGGTGYGGGQLSTGATGATGPTFNDLGFAETTDDQFFIFGVHTVPRGVTGAIYNRTAAYDPYNEKLIIGATAGTDISDVTYRVVACGRFAL
jgi:hypothetical protein